MIQFVTLIERNAGRISIPNEIWRLELPCSFYFVLEVGPCIRGLNNRRFGNILTDTHAICQAYGGVESVEASLTYYQTGSFKVARIMPAVASDGSGSDSDTASDAGSGSVVTQL